MDGDLAPLPALARPAQRHGALLAVDDAHGLGVLGASGGGSLEHFGALGARGAGARRHARQGLRQLRRVRRRRRRPHRDAHPARAHLHLYDGAAGRGRGGDARGARGFHRRVLASRARPRAHAAFPAARRRGRAAARAVRHADPARPARRCGRCRRGEPPPPRTRLTSSLRSARRRCPPAARAFASHCRRRTGTRTSRASSRRSPIASRAHERPGPRRPTPPLLDRAAIRRYAARASARYDESAVLAARAARRAREAPRMDLLRAGGDAGPRLRHGPRRRRARGALAARPRDRARRLARACSSRRSARRRRHASSGCCADAEAIPLPDASVDLVFSNLMLPWCEDIDAVFAEVGAAAAAGPCSPSRLRAGYARRAARAWRTADARRVVHPFTDMHDLGDGLVRAGLAEPVLDVSRFTPDLSGCRRADARPQGDRRAERGHGRARGLTGRGRLEVMAAAYEEFRARRRVCPRARGRVRSGVGRALAPRRRGMASSRFPVGTSPPRIRAPLTGR